MRPSSAIYFCGPIADAGKPAKGGYQARNLRTIEALRSREFEVHALPYAQPTSSRTRKLIEYATGFTALAWKMARCKKKSIVHITGLRRVFLYPEFALAYIAKRRECRVIYDIRDGLGLDAVRLEHSAVYRYLFARLLNSVDLIMVQGEAQVPFVESFTGIRPVLIPNQIDISAIPTRTYSSTPVTPVIAYAGALKPEKGLSKMLDAVEILAGQGFDVEVCIAGTGDEKFIENLRSRYSRLAVRWLGPQTAECVLDLFANSHFFLFPTWWPGEGQSNALTEAMASGCVPIVSDHGFNAATVGNCGAVLKPDQGAADYAAAVQQIWASGQWDTLSERSAQRVREHYSSVAVIDHLTEHYAALERTFE